VKFAVPSLGQNTHLHVAFMGGSSIRFCTVTGASPWVATAIDMTLTNAEAGVTGIVFSVDASASPPYSATLTNLHFIANQFLTNTVTNFYLSTEQPKTSNTGVIADFDCERAMIDTAINDAAAAAYQAAADYVDAFPVASASLATGLDWQILGNYDFTQNSFTNDGDVTEAWTNLEGNTHNAWQTNAGWGLHAGGTNLCWTLGTTTQNVYRITWRLIAYGSSPSSVVLMPRGETKSAGYPVAVTYTSMFYTLKHTGRIDFKVASYYDTPFLQSCKIEAAYDTNYFNKFDARLEPSRDKVIDIGNPTNRWKTGYFESVDVGTSIWFSATERLAFRTTNLYWCVAGNTGLVNITWGTPMP
jgi:hypothetical protein